MTPAISATDSAPTINQAATATTPPVTNAPGTFPMLVRSTPPNTMVRMKRMGAYC